MKENEGTCGMGRSSGYLFGSTPLPLCFHNCQDCYLKVIDYLSKGLGYLDMSWANDKPSFKGMEIC